MTDSARRRDDGGDGEADNILVIEGVSRRFGAIAAVDGVDLAVRRGELFSLLGESGCGKTTLLRMVAGFELPDSGRILIDGEDMTRVPPFERPVNMVFQSYALFPHMTVGENVAYGLRQEGMARAERNDRVGEVLALVDLSEMADRKPDRLSGGQRQRVALARGLAKRPKILLLDEPLGALDRRLRARTQLELVNLQDRIGTTFILVTHDQDEAMTMSDRIAVMRGGRIHQIGPPRDVYENPVSRFVADFIGAANLFDGEVMAMEGGTARVRLATGGTTVAVAADLSVGTGARVTVMVRPEKIQCEIAAIGRSVGPGPDSDNVNVLTGVVRDVAYLGDLSVYHVESDGGLRLQVAMANRHHRTQRVITWDDTVRLSWHPGDGMILSV
jgi:putrescine transport system ATP-binding protein